MTCPVPTHARRGAALFLTLLISIAVAAMALGAVLLSRGAQIATGFSAREAALQSSANGGLELIRDSVNRGNFDTLLPLNSFTTLASNAVVTDAMGGTLPGITRSLYVGRTGGRTGGSATAGQYGSNFASGLSIISDRRGAVAARRLLMTQESWAKFAVAINNWSGSAAYGCSESVSGPFHSNTGLILSSGCSSPKTLFTGPVTVAGSITNQSSGDYRAGVKTSASPIPWPTPARINLMRQFAQDADAANGDYDLISSTNGSAVPGLRIEFVTIDVNGNGLLEWDEGFMRVWRPANNSDSVLAFTTGRRWPSVPSGTTPADDPNMISRTCGATVQLNGSGSTVFRTASDIYAGTTGSSANKRAAVRAALTDGTRRCLLGGDPRLYRSTTFDTLTPDSTVTNVPASGNGFGWWQKRRAGALGSLGSARPGDRSYLIPLGANPNFKGVIFVQGDVAISGRLRGRVSIFATGNVILADDLTYQNPPGTNCDVTGDIFGAIATRDVIIEDNNLQSPFKVNTVVWGGFDDTNDANYNMFLLAAGSGAGTDGNFYGEGVQSPWSPPVQLWSGQTVNASAVSQRCGNAPNGCIRITGGLAQGRVDNATYYNQRFGWGEAHTYDPCGAVNPPPYFPTTGRFVESRYYEIDPVWLRQMTVAEFFSRLRAQ
ncbi:MAG: hypothetical protein ABJC19_04170 [Gemmatimonadota bacterium]